MIKLKNLFIVQNKRKVGAADFKDRKVVLHVERREITILDGIGKEIWECCSKPVTISEITRILSSSFPKVCKGIIEKDTISFVEDLIGKNLLLKISKMEDRI